MGNSNILRRENTEKKNNEELTSAFAQPCKKVSRLAGLQYLRGFAALFVVIDHLRGMAALPKYYGIDPFPWLGYGAVGVDIFFTISGFIITIVCFEVGNLRPRIGVVDFFKYRFARIIPFLWVCVLAYAVVRSLGTGAHDYGNYLRAITLWPLGEVRPNVVWTLRHEALFYALFAAAMLWKRYPALLFVWILSPLAFLWDADALGELGAFLFNPVNLEFGSGVLGGWFYLKNAERFTMPTRHTFFAVLALSVAVFGVAIAFDLGVRTVGVAFVLAIMSLGLVMFSARPAGDQGLARAVGELLGDASYSIYLTHGLFILMFFEAARRVAPSIGFLSVFLTAGVMAVCGGIVVHRLVERPLVRRCQRLFGIGH